MCKSFTVTYVVTTESDQSGRKEYIPGKKVTSIFSDPNIVIPSQIRIETYLMFYLKTQSETQLKKKPFENTIYPFITDAKIKLGRRICLSHVSAGVDAAFGVFTIQTLDRHMSATRAKDLRKGNFESLFNFLQDLLILLAADKRDGQTLGTETTGTTDTMQV